MVKYFVSHQEQQMGPYTADEIVGLVQKGTLSPLDYLFDEQANDWVLFLDHHAISAQVQNLKPKAPPKAQEKEAVHTKPVTSDLLNREWFVLKGDNKFGPFGYPDVVKMLQQGVVFEFDFAWHEDLDGWHRIAEIADFSKDKIKELKNSEMPEISQVFFRRRHRRVKYGGTILIHDNKKVWKGQAMEISEGGAGVVMHNSMVVPGQQLYLHFKPGDGVPPFNAICEVVSKQFTSELKDPNAPVKYGLKFKTISTETQKFLHHYTKGGAAA